MATTHPSDPVEVLVRELTARHGISPTAALTVLCRAARRKQTSLDELAGRILRPPTHGSEVTWTASTGTA